MLLYLISPSVGLPGLSAVVPTGNKSDSVELIFTLPVPCGSKIKSELVGVKSVVLSAVISPKLDPLPDPTPKGPVYLAPSMYTDLPVNDLPFGKFVPIKFITPDS